MSLNASHQQAEVRDAFETFLDRGARGRDWHGWSSLFTDDAVYTEHCLGQFHGATGIESWITAAMQPVACMTFSLEWTVIEGNYVTFWIWNHLPSPPGSDREFCFPNFSILVYNGDGKWSAEEDFYDPAWAGCVIDWYRAGGSPSQPANPALVPSRPSHPTPPSIAPERHVVMGALADACPPGTAFRHDVVGGSVGIGIYDTDERAYAVIVHVDPSGQTIFSQTVTNPNETTNPARR